MAHSFPNNSASDYHGEQREASITRKGQRNRGHTLSFDRSWLVCTLAFSTGRSFTLKAVIVVVYVTYSALNPATTSEAPLPVIDFCTNRKRVC